MHPCHIGTCRGYSCPKPAVWEALARFEVPAQSMRRNLQRCFIPGCSVNVHFQGTVRKLGDTSKKTASFLVEELSSVANRGENGSKISKYIQPHDLSGEFPSLPSVEEVLCEYFLFSSTSEQGVSSSERGTIFIFVTRR